MSTLVYSDAVDATALAILEDAPTAIVVRDQSGGLIIANRVARELLGREIDSGHPLSNISTAFGLYIAGTDSLYPTERLPMAVALDGVECHADDIEVRRPDKTARLMAKAVPTFGPDGRVTHAIATFVDVTELRNAETERALTEALAQAIVRAPTFGDAVQMSLDRICEITGWTFGQAWLPDGAGVHLHCEQASKATRPELAEYHAVCRELLLEAGMDLPGRVWLTQEPEWWSDLSPDLQPRMGTGVLSTIPPGFRHRVAIPVLADGDVVAVFCFFVPARSEHDQRLLERVVNVIGQVGAWVATRRIRDLRSQQVQDALDLEQQAVARLKTLYTVKDTVLHSITHDLRSPIAAVLTLTRALLADNAGEQVLPREMRAKMLANVERGAHEMERLLHDLVDSEPMHDLDRSRHRCDVGDIAVRTLRASDLAALHPVHTRIESVIISANAAHVERIVHNLVTNAGKHVAPGLAIWVSVEPSADGVLIRVEDEGAGVPPDVAEQIFEPFHRGAHATSDGLGLGLSLVARFAQSHGGRAWVEDRVGGGASFRVYLPDNGG